MIRQTSLSGFEINISRCLWLAICDLIKRKQVLLISILIWSIGLSGCRSVYQSKDDLKAATQIHFDGFETSAKALDYFDRESVIIIETKGDSILIPGLTRVIEHDGVFYALDRRNLTVMGFDRSGKIVCMVDALGRSLLEYQSIDDIAWNDSKDCLMLLAQNKILYADKMGKIFDAVSLSTYYRGFVMNGKQFILANSTYVNQEHSAYSISIMSDDGDLKKEVLPTLPEYAPFCAVKGPGITCLNRNVYFTRLFDSCIYDISSDGSVKAKFCIDFGKSGFVAQEDTEYDCSELYMKCLKSKQIYAMSDMQEGKEMISLSTNLSGIMMIDKSDKSAAIVNSFYDYSGKVPLPNYIPVELSDGLVFFYMDAQYFRNFAEYSGSSELKEMAEAVSEESNPVILTYRLK